MKIYFIDNFDSFTYNLVYDLEGLGHSVLVLRNTTPANTLFERMQGEKEKTLLFISPGPSDPEHAGQLLPILAKTRGHFPILGICLGLQALAQSYGARVVRSPAIVHGKSSPITLKPFEAFKGLGDCLQVGRYHSLMVSDLPDCLQVIAHYQDIIMGIYHPQDKALAYQFHPESIMTLKGAQLLKQSLDFLITPS
ncbi:aminodeoxychorismate/anthranilate synthase component II [Helicobacter felis]|uniref:Anthranilate synthase component II n=1 Tax=Helicobacter felis (strain ATCC 49179 / CCUG 28539 / NCTC 12436 / CS1) TaxID=936155 RepID=E7ABY4_HELFC|nr:aminodeoxychorismate/anthranilate synthase component II [Helicobacter felis]CBY82953.1 anthranilate synthase component II [Helicobacter felis ATCC 49179]